MNEVNIQKPCDNCELSYLLDTPRGIELVALGGLYIATLNDDALESCRHPWRLLYQAYEENPNEYEKEILSKTVEIRGKNPEDYNLPTNRN
jgi:hypothetical protein